MAGGDATTQLPLWTTRLEYVTCRMLVAIPGASALGRVRFYRGAGWDDEALEHYKARFGSFGKAVYTLRTATGASSTVRT